ARLLPSFRNRATYLPRTPPFMDAKSYSGFSSSSCVRLALLIEFSLAPRGASGIDDANRVAIVGMCNHEQPSELRCANSHEPGLLHRVALVGESRRQRILEHGCGFVEAHSMLPEVGRMLRRVPGELHRDSIRTRPQAHASASSSSGRR